MQTLDPQLGLRSQPNRTTAGTAYSVDCLSLASAPGSSPGPSSPHERQRSEGHVRVRMNGIRRAVRTTAKLTTTVTKKEGMRAMTISSGGTWTNVMTCQYSTIS